VQAISSIALFSSSIKLERARNDREQKHDEFDGQSYSEYWESNDSRARSAERCSCSWLSCVSWIFFGEVSAFDQNDLEIRALGNAVEDVIYKVKEMDNEMLKQGDVFVERLWDEQFIKQKKLKGAGFDGRLKGIS